MNELPTGRARILSWNIMQSGGNRADAIVRAIQSHGPDVILLSEIRSKSSQPLLQKLRDSGWAHTLFSNPPGIEYGVAVLSRHPILRVPDPSPTPCGGNRWLEFTIPDHAFSIVCTHIPMNSQKQPTLKNEYWDAVLAAAEKRIAEPVLLIGDFNTGKHRIDETGRTFRCADKFGQLEASGWTDAWRHFHGANTESTWYSRLKGAARGNGFRLDHAFVTPALLPRVSRCWYSHDEREAGISDHSILMVETE